MTVSLPDMPARIRRLPRDERGYPLLEKEAWKDGVWAIDELARQAAAAMKLLPAA
jgi:hypothetical protein